MRPVLRTLFNDAAGNTRGKVLGIYGVLLVFNVGSVALGNSRAAPLSSLARHGTIGIQLRLAPCCGR